MSSLCILIMDACCLVCWCIWKLRGLREELEDPVILAFEVGGKVRSVVSNALLLVLLLFVVCRFGHYIY